MGRCFNLKKVVLFVPAESYSSININTFFFLSACSVIGEETLQTLQNHLDAPDFDISNFIYFFFFQCLPALNF